MEGELHIYRNHDTGLHYALHTPEHSDLRVDDFGQIVGSSNGHGFKMLFGTADGNLDPVETIVIDDPFDED